MSTLKEELKLLAKKYKFWFAISDLDDKDILEFIQEDIFVCDNLNLTFEQAKASCEKVLGKTIDSFIDPSDQQTLYRLLQKYNL